ALSVILFPLLSTAGESTCYGNTSKGRLENGVKLPDSGRNFRSYSSVGAVLGRTYLHSSAHKVVVDTYAAIEKSMPDSVYVYGETGWKDGGRIRPHRTHQNGLSIDFMVPVTDTSGKSVSLPTSTINKYGYNIEFDNNGRYKDLKIDFESMAEHLYQLSLTAKREGVGISLVILDPPLLPMLLKTKRGAYIRKNLPFMKGKAWVRHDDHYHVDFSVPCKPFHG
ncbi:MAG: peptidase, partial [Paucimonas sp.]|nr:peptidase [Paucimonas sp.]